MARIRTIKPEFWTDSLLVQMPHLTRLLYVALWNVADDHGFVRDEPDRLAMEVMPRENPEDIDAHLQLLFAAGRLELFVDDDGYSYYRVTKWEDHQKVDHPSKSRISRESSRKVAIPNDTRRAVAEKYGCPAGETIDATCYYCGAPGKVHWFRLSSGRPSTWIVFPGLELDHMECEHEGGETVAGNIVLACRSCNRGKSTKHWVDFFLSRAIAKPRESSRPILDLDQGRGKGKEVAEAPLIEGVNPIAWKTWIDYRHQIRKPLKPVSMPAAQKTLAAFGSEQMAVVQQSVANGWQGLFPVKQINGAHRLEQPTRRAKEFGK